MNYCKHKRCELNAMNGKNFNKVFLQRIINKSLKQLFCGIINNFLVSDLR